MPEAFHFNDPCVKRLPELLKRHVIKKNISIFFQRIGGYEDEVPRLFVPESPENVAAGSTRGWRTILHETPEQSRKAVEQFIL